MTQEGLVESEDDLGTIDVASESVEKFHCVDGHDEESIRESDYPGLVKEDFVFHTKSS
jgi:hypothetical protein